MHRRQYIGVEEQQQQQLVKIKSESNMPSSSASNASETRTMMKVLSLGLPRTGSASLAKALTILGYKNVCHGINIVDHAPLSIIRLFDRAADACHPALPTYTGQKFGIEDWEELYADCEASTDVAGLFSSQMMECYPDAKVILVIRPFEQWYESMNDGVFNIIFGRPADFVCGVVEPILGTSYLAIGRKLILGLFDAKNVHEIRANARSIYDRHHARIMEAKATPSELLIFDLKDGWAPLCQFLDKPVPEEAFPRVNERAAIQAKMLEIMQRDAMYAVKKSIPWLMTAVAVGAVAAYLKLI